MVYDKETELSTPELSPRYDIVDSHLHFLDFTQDSDGFPMLTKAMDAAGVSEAVVFGMPIVKKWDHYMKEKPLYYMSDDSRCYYYSGTDHILAHELMEQSEEVRRRFHPFCCGVDCTDKYAADQIETSAHVSEFLAGHRRALEHNRKTKIIWAHVGVSRRIEMEDLLIYAGELLNNHPNLYVDISWLFFENYIRGDLLSKLISGDEKSNIFADMWAALIEKYSDRVMIGSDKVGHWTDYTHEIFKYYLLLERVSQETVRKVCKENILSLIKKW